MKDEDNKKAVLEEIDDKLTEAKALIKECTDLADAHGIVFRAYLMNMSNIYAGTEEKFTNEYGEDEQYDYAGWQSSYSEGC